MQRGSKPRPVGSDRALVAVGAVSGRGRVRAQQFEIHDEQIHFGISHALSHAQRRGVDAIVNNDLPKVLGVVLLAVLGASPLLYWLRFDFNPVNLRSPKVESVATYLELKNSPDNKAPARSDNRPTATSSQQVARVDAPKEQRAEPTPPPADRWAANR